MIRNLPTFSGNRLANLFGTIYDITLDIINWLLNFGSSTLQALPINALLILITIVISGASYKFQIRNGIRESIEQLDDEVVGHSFKIKPILYRFPRIPYLWGKVKIEFKYYNFSRASNPVAGVSKTRDLSQRLESEAQSKSDIDGVEIVDNADEVILSSLFGEIENMDYVSGVGFEDGVDGLIVDLDTMSSVEIRNTASEIMMRLADFINRRNMPNEEVLEKYDIEASE